MGHGFGTVEYVTTATKDYGYAECEYWLLQFEFSKVRETR
jgi:hypothetical protein